jgi:hypothetical protein
LPFRPETLRDCGASARVSDRRVPRQPLIALLVERDLNRLNDREVVEVTSAARKA